MEQMKSYRGVCITNKASQLKPHHNMANNTAQTRGQFPKLRRRHFYMWFETFKSCEGGVFCTVSQKPMSFNGFKPVNNIQPLVSSIVSLIIALSREN